MKRNPTQPYLSSRVLTETLLFNSLQERLKSKHFHLGPNLREVWEPARVLLASTFLLYIGRNLLVGIRKSQRKQPHDLLTEILVAIKSCRYSQQSGSWATIENPPLKETQSSTRELRKQRGKIGLLRAPAPLLAQEILSASSSMSYGELLPAPCRHPSLLLL